MEVEKEAEYCHDDTSFLDPCECPVTCTKGNDYICKNNPNTPVRKVCQVKFLFVEHDRSKITVTENFFPTNKNLNVTKADINWEALRRYFADVWLFDITYTSSKKKSDTVMTKTTLWAEAFEGLIDSADGCSFGVAYMYNPDDFFITGEARPTDRKAAYINRKRVPKEYVTQTVAHEIGHLFGLCHPEDTPMEPFQTYLMDPAASNAKKSGLHPRDKSRLKKNVDSSDSIPGTPTKCGSSKLSY